MKQLLHGILQCHQKIHQLHLSCHVKTCLFLPKSGELAMEGVKKGAYIVSPATKEQADAILIATGSEVSLAVAAQAKLKAEGIDVCCCFYAFMGSI